MTWTIYRIDFPADGAAYIGITGRPLRERLRGHLQSPSNRELYFRLKREEYTVETVARYADIDRAAAREIKEIAKLEKPVNLYHTRAPRCLRHHHGAGEVGTEKWREIRAQRAAGRDYNRDEHRTQRCRVCQQNKPASGFASDRSRSSGLASKCKDCGNWLRAWQQRYLTAGLTAKEGYAAGLERIRRGDGSHKTELPPPPYPAYKHQPSTDACVVCGAGLLDERGRRLRKRYCSGYCNNLAEYRARRGLAPNDPAADPRCRQCGKEFDPPNRLERYCTDDCRRAARIKNQADYRRRLRGKQGEIPGGLPAPWDGAPKPCAECGAEFKPYRPQAKYCGALECKRAVDRRYAKKFRADNPDYYRQRREARRAALLAGGKPAKNHPSTRDHPEEAK